MSVNEGQDRRTSKKNALVEALRNPAQLRAAVLAAVLAAGYGVIYLPLNGKIDLTNQKLANSRNQLKLATEVEQLRKQFQQVEKRLPQQTDATEWMEFVLNGIRRSPLKLESFSPGTVQAGGAYQVITLNIKLSGSLEEVDKFVQWLESNERLFRVDTLKWAPANVDGEDCVSMDITVLGVIS
jgi:Tfp pilus assembly protein PilO